MQCAETGGRQKGFTRRNFVKISLFSIMGLLASRSSLLAGNSLKEKKVLAFYNYYTRESCHVVYNISKNYIPKSLVLIDYIMRDRRTGEIKPIDTDLLDLLYNLKTRINSNSPFFIVSGYRSLTTNNLLRQKNRRVAKNSLHLQGQAVDLYMPTCRLSKLRQAAVELKGGGVGYYPTHGFIHIDVGAVRYWNGS